MFSIASDRFPQKNLAVTTIYHGVFNWRYHPFDWDIMLVIPLDLDQAQEPLQLREFTPSFRGFGKPLKFDRMNRWILE